MESKDISGQSLITASFILADETASARVRLQNNDEIRKLKNGDILILKNGRVDVIGNKLIIGNDIWSKIMIISDKTLENVNRSFNISEIQYDIKSFWFDEVLWVEDVLRMPNGKKNSCWLIYDL